MTQRTRVATDVGGTFTDLVAFDVDPATGAQTVRTAKVDTTPPDFERGVLEVLDKAGIAAADVAVFAHGTTVIINALMERKVARVGLITTAGFRDVLEIGRGNRPDFFNLRYAKPEPFVPRHLRRELPGRLDYRGRETAPLDLSGLPAILDDFRAESVQAVAIVLLHAYANTAHEAAALAEVRRLWPEASAVASHQITREWREYERSSTTVLSACVQPVAARYLGRLSDGLQAKGFGGQLYVMQSNCGVDLFAAAAAIPITMVESGPASGFWGAAEMGRLIGEPNVLALDIGGTTAKCSLIEGGQVRIKTDYAIERDRRSAGYPIMVPVVDLVEIGNGGGSIAWVDDFGKLHVGPQSAGASPGPAAYGRGGTDATTTDANLALGRIGAELFRGGAAPPDMAAAGAALDRLASRLGVAQAEAARGVVRVANHNMVNALRLISLDRGYDPRDFTLLVFGGGGALHAAALAAELGIRRVVVPRDAGVFSAWGMLVSDLRRDTFLSCLISEGEAAPAALRAAIAELADVARARFASEGIGAVALSAAAKCRYQNQEHSVEVSVDVEPDAAAAAGMFARFHDLYEREYTYRLAAPVEVVGVHLTAVADIGKLEPARAELGPDDASAARKGFRDVDLFQHGVRSVAVYDAGRLRPGMRFHGPAAVEDASMTLIANPGDTVRVDEYGNYRLDLAGSADRGDAT